MTVNSVEGGTSQRSPELYGVCKKVLQKLRMFPIIIDGYNKDINWRLKTPLDESRQ